jgi:hypothetical protein
MYNITILFIWVNVLTLHQDESIHEIMPLIGIDEKTVDMLYGMFHDIDVNSSGKRFSVTKYDLFIFSDAFRMSNI